MASCARFLIDAIKGIKFDVDELAYLALTSKIEFAFRDRLAFGLHQSLSSQGYTVAREWNRVDLAILNGKYPEALIEIKAMYSFDAATGQYEKLAQQDALKCRNKWSEAQVFTLLLMTHPTAMPNAELRG